MTLSSEGVLERAAVGARLLTVRGATIRIVSVLSNLALIVLVPPAGLGLLAVVRGVTGLAGNTADLGFAWALLRRPERPTEGEYRALAGVQLTLVVLWCAFVLFAPRTLLSLSAVPDAMQPWLLAAVLTLLSIPFGTAARIRLEREMEYRRLAFVDLSSALLQNGLLLGFGIGGQFAIGVFVATGASILYCNVLYWIWAPSAWPAFELRTWRRLAREFAGFSAGHVGSVLGAAVTPILIANLLGLSAAGIWAFATRLGNVLQLAFEGFRRAAVPAAALLVHSRDQLHRLVQSSLDGAARIAVPMIAALFAGLPVVGWLLPKWGNAVIPGQAFILAFGLAGVAGASLVPASVALSGSRIILVEQFAPLIVGWIAIGVLAWRHSDQLAWAILPMYGTLLLSLWICSEPELRPRWKDQLSHLGTGLLLAVLVTIGGQVMGVQPLIAAGVAAAFFAAGGRYLSLSGQGWLSLGGRRAW